MALSELLERVVEVLERLGVPYFVTGSTASIFYGEPRFTNDIDIVVRLAPEQVHGLCAAFPPEEFYVSEQAALDAVTKRTQFNVIHPSSGLKVDVIVAADTPFNRGRFVRRRTLRTAPQRSVFFASPEDVIVKKLEFFREGGSDKHLRDIASMLKVSGDALDRDYVTEWAERLGLADIWRMVLERST